MSRSDYLKYKFGSKELAQPMYNNMNTEAIKEGLRLNLKNIQVTPNTKFSHILVKLAFRKKIGHEVLKEIFNSYFSKGIDIGNIDTLIKIGRSKTIEEKEIVDAFSSKKEINEISKNDITTRSMGINGVPFFIINDKTYISGAPSTSNLIEAIKVNL